MLYDVWDSESANIVGAFQSEGEALDALGHALREHGSSYVSILVLGVEDESGASEMIATGTALVRLIEDHLGSKSVSLLPAVAGPSSTETSAGGHPRR